MFHIQVSCGALQTWTRNMRLIGFTTLPHPLEWYSYNMPWNSLTMSDLCYGGSRGLVPSNRRVSSLLHELCQTYDTIIERYWKYRRLSCQTIPKHIISLPSPIMLSCSFWKPAYRAYPFSPLDNSEILHFFLLNPHDIHDRQFKKKFKKMFKNNLKTYYWLLNPESS